MRLVSLGCGDQMGVLETFFSPTSFKPPAMKDVVTCKIHLPMVTTMRTTHPIRGRVRWAN